MGDRELPGFGAAIDDGETRDLDRTLERHELKKIQRDAVRGMLESAVAEAMADDIGRGRLANGQGGRGPKITGDFVANVDGLCGYIADGIVGPWRELILLRVQ